MELPQHIQTVFRSSKCLYTKQQVEMALDRMAKEISAKLADTNPIFLCIVVGGIIPLGNLLPRLDFPLEVDYVHASRYRGKTSGGELHWKSKHTCSLKERTIVVVDDILDSGLTMKAVVDYCKSEGAKAVYSVALVDKKEARQPGGLQQADFVGLEVGNHYVFGYGMDYKEYLRNAPGIYAVSPEYLTN